MSEIKVPEVPAPEKEMVETTEPVLESRREEVEKAVALANDIPTEVKTEVEEPKIESKEKEEILDPVERVKKASQKRIDKVIAQKKSAEEELAEARAEIERLKAPKEEKVQDDKPVTQAQVKAYIAKCQREGNFEEATEAIDYLTEMKKNEAIKNLQEEQKTTQTKTAAETSRQNAEMKLLANDYVVYDESGKPDIKSDMTLANQNGLLFKLAMDYFNDKDRHAEMYNDPNVVNGFRRAVNHAYIDITEHNRINRLTPKGEVTERRDTKKVLADPDANFSEEVPESNNKSLSEADVAREEIKNRKKNLYKRPIPQ